LRTGHRYTSERNRPPLGRRGRAGERRRLSLLPSPNRGSVKLAAPLHLTGTTVLVQPEIRWGLGGARVRPRVACFRFTRQDHCGSAAPCNSQLPDDARHPTEIGSNGERRQRSSSYQSLHQPSPTLAWIRPDAGTDLKRSEMRTWHAFATEWRRYCFVRYMMGAGSSTILKSAGTVNNDGFGSARTMFVRRNVCSPIRGSLRLL